MLKSDIKILIVDDEPIITEALSSSLEEEGWQVFANNKGQEAMHRARNVIPDAAIIDLKLSDVSGLEVARFIKGIDPEICIIIITAYAEMETAISALLEGAYDYITKPFDITHIKSVIRKGLEKRMLTLENRELVERLKREKRKLEAILEISRMFNMIVTLNDLVNFTVVKVSQLLEAQRGSLMLLDKDSGHLFICGAYGLNEEVIKSTRLKIGESIAGRVVETGEPLWVIDIENDLRFLRKNNIAYVTKSFISVPLKKEKEIVGVFNFSNKVPLFTEDDVAFVSIVAHQAAIAIEKIRLYDTVNKLAITDDLTGLFNRRYFIRQLEEEIKRNKRYHHSFSLIMFDIDDFKKFNDIYGHLMGDVVLRKIAEILDKNVRNVDIVSRYGGEEFIVILPETDIDEAVSVAEKIRKACEETLLKEDDMELIIKNSQKEDNPSARNLTLSGGVANYNTDLSKEEFIKKVDAALYQAKAAGKNRVECSPLSII